MTSNKAFFRMDRPLAHVKQVPSPHELARQTTSGSVRLARRGLVSKPLGPGGFQTKPPASS